MFLLASALPDLHKNYCALTCTSRKYSDRMLEWKKGILLIKFTFEEVVLFGVSLLDILFVLLGKEAKNFWISVCLSCVFLCVII